MLLEVPVEYRKSSNYDSQDFANFYISLFGAVPFGILLISFIIVWWRRKIEDYYLKWSIGVFIAAMAMRVIMSLIMTALTLHD